ncbi:MAG: hypothetical protein QOH24_1083 [Verrucomicrobiota bacterium]|jgi:hypothetical protein
MTTRLEITCSNKGPRDGAHFRVEGIGGRGWKHTEEEAIRYIDEGVHSYYIKRKGLVVDVIVAELPGYKYIKTMLDGNRPENLLRLPDCI